MSHSIGRIVADGTRIGPDSGTPETLPEVWEFEFTPNPALNGEDPLFVILHFTEMNFPGDSRLEIDLGYDTDIFTAASGVDAWTRPIDPQLGPILIRYRGAGDIGGVTLSEYGSGEPTETGTPGVGLGSRTNPDIFLHIDPTETYEEPIYAETWQCGDIGWENAACSVTGTVEEETARAVCIIVMVHRDDFGTRQLSSCTGTLIDADLVLTAGHCVDDPDRLEERSGSVCFDYQTTCLGGKPDGYAPKFHKIKRIKRLSYSEGDPDVPDWAILQIETPVGGLGIRPRSLRRTAVTGPETAFAIHHPNGAVKKIQTGEVGPPPEESRLQPSPYGFDYAGGSSGSALFDEMGSIIGGALASGTGCDTMYTSSRTILDDLASPPAPPTPFDVMLVMDRSGSMGSEGTSGAGRTKLDEAQDAASLFVQLVRIGAGDRMGMVSFSTSANRPPDTRMDPVTAGQKVLLVGPSPYLTGSVGELTADGTTSIGDGLLAAIESLETASANQRAVLLLYSQTDCKTPHP